MSVEVTGNFDIYLEKYCNDRNITVEEAMRHEIVMAVKASYEEDEKLKVKDAK